MAFGEQNPTEGEIAVSWQTFSDGAAGIPTISGDADWGKISLNINQEGRSRVYDFGSSGLIKISLNTDVYEAGQGTATLQYRYSESLFAQDDILPAWTNYTGVDTQTLRYIQVRVEK